MAKKKAKSTTEIVATMLRLPENLRDALQGSAQENGSSLNREMVDRLERSFMAEAEIVTLQEMLSVFQRLAGNAASEQLGQQVAAEMRARPNWYGDQDAPLIANAILALFNQLSQDRLNIATLGIALNLGENK